MIEIEIKLPIDDQKQTERKLKTLGFVTTCSRIERDIYFDGGKDIWKNDQVLRVRCMTDCVTGEETTEVTYKGRKLDTVSMSRLELETTVGDGGTIMKILQALGFEPIVPQVIKKRQMMTFANIHACLDEVEGLGTFLELEIMANDEAGRPEALRRIEKILEGLGYSISDTVRSSYMSQLLRKTDSR